MHKCPAELERYLGAHQVCKHSDLVAGAALFWNARSDRYTLWLREGIQWHRAVEVNAADGLGVAGVLIVMRRLGVNIIGENSDSPTEIIGQPV